MFPYESMEPLKVTSIQFALDRNELGRQMKAWGHWSGHFRNGRPRTVVDVIKLFLKEI